MGVSLACSRCGVGADSEVWSWRCEACGGPLDFVEEPELDYIPSLGEPQSPLVQIRLGSRSVTAKIEGALPTGSFKDRGSRLVVAGLHAYGVTHAVIDSSGNAGASLAAYCARGGIRCDVYVPDTTSPAKLAQMEIFGARIQRVPGSRQDVAEAALSAAASAAYAAHGWTPWFLLGTATFAYELVEQLRRCPDAIVVPVGAGTLLLGIARGFSRLVRDGVVERMPRLYGVQATACAPLALAYERGLDPAPAIGVSDTAAEGIKIQEAPRAAQILKAVRDSGGMIVAVDDRELWKAFAQLASQGLLVEPTSAVAFAGLDQLPLDDRQSVVVAATATGLKAIDAVRAARGVWAPSLSTP